MSLNSLPRELQQLEETKTYKHEVPLQSAQDGMVKVNGKKVVMLASNNYLGLSNHPAVKKAAIEGIKEYGYGVASVRFICGTQDIHFKLEKKISKFLGTEDTILFSSCWAANEAFFASLTNEKLGMETLQGRDLFGPPQPCQHHRRAAALQGRDHRPEDLPACGYQRSGLAA